MMMINGCQTPSNMSSIRAVWDSLGKTFLSLLVDNLGATGRLRLNSSPVKLKLIIFLLFLPEGNAILPITPKAVCALLSATSSVQGCGGSSMEADYQLHLVFRVAAGPLRSLTISYI